MRQFFVNWLALPRAGGLQLCRGPCVQSASQLVDVQNHRLIVVRLWLLPLRLPHTVDNRFELDLGLKEITRKKVSGCGKARRLSQG